MSVEDQRYSWRHSTWILVCSPHVIKEVLKPYQLLRATTRAANTRDTDRLNFFLKSNEGKGWWKLQRTKRLAH